MLPKLSSVELVAWKVHQRLISAGWHRIDLEINFVKKMAGFTLQHNRHSPLRFKLAVCPKTSELRSFGACKLTMGEYVICKWLGLEESDMKSKFVDLADEVQEISEEVVTQIDLYLGEGGSLEDFDGDDNELSF